MDLEYELGTELLLRGKRQVILTSSGILFQQRAQEIVALLEKTELDIAEHNNVVEGVISIGCVETTASLLLPDALEAFNYLYTKVQYQIYTGDSDYIRDKIDSGFVDTGILLEPVEIAKYEFVLLPFQDIWDVLMRKDDSLSKKDSLCVSNIIGFPFFLSHRRIVTDEIEGWFGKMANKLNILGYHNLLTNTALLIERGLCYSITVQGAYTIRPNVNLRFVPLSLERKAGHVMAWKKNRIFGQATALFLEYVKKIIIVAF